MACSLRNTSLALAVALNLLLPVSLFADGPVSPSLTVTEPKVKPAAGTSAVDTAAKPVPGAVDSAALPTGPLAVEKILVSAPRELLPFSPAVTVRSQLLTVDSEWRGAVSVDGGITVGPAATLTINPGTVVRFAKNSGIHVLGRIVIRGTVENPVRLGSLYREAQDSDWSGIFLAGTEKKNVFEHVSIEGAETAVFARFSALAATAVTISNAANGFKLQSAVASIVNTQIAVPVTAITAVKSELFLDKCTLAGGQSGIIVTASALEGREVSIKQCRLTALSAYASQLKLEKLSVSACQSGLRLNRVDGSVSGSTFTDNLETAVVISGSNLRFSGNTVSGSTVGVQVDDNLPSLWANSISGNSSYNLIYLGDESLYAGGNNFGGKTTSEVDAKIFSTRPGAVQLLPVFFAEPLNQAH